MKAGTQSLQNQSEKPIAESHHIDISTDGYNDCHSNMSTDGHVKDVAKVEEEIKDSHTNISIDGYVGDAPCEYKVVPVDEDMSTNDHFQEQSCENNTMEEPSVVEEPTIFEDAAEASTIATDLVNDEAIDSTTSSADFCSQGEIMRITDDPVNNLNAPDDTQIELKPRTPHIKFVDDANKFSVVIFVDLAATKEERLLQKEKRLDSYSFESIIDKKPPSGPTPATTAPSPPFTGAALFGSRSASFTTIPSSSLSKSRPLLHASVVLPFFISTATNLATATTIFTATDLRKLHCSTYDSNHVAGEKRSRAPSF
ncbi:hypothetical protein DEO72_LG2g2689 [Vigna unguiculata]|uniref:Uncharacterized protein n=1 Tax=Vigna unguiculata TaxID=3917 RepID=A0A4D6L1H6_VIGUN|nr:hypothetical protein DEO72_LG2g2689 [Vigna unguiculata]